MVFRNTFNDGLVKAELDISGKNAVLRIEVDSAVRESMREEYEQEAQKGEEEYNMAPFEYDMRRKKFHTVAPDEYAWRNIEIEIEQAVRDARDWAREKTKMEIEVIFVEE